MTTSEQNGQKACSRQQCLTQRMTIAEIAACSKTMSTSVTGRIYLARLSGDPQLSGMLPEPRKTPREGSPVVHHKKGTKWAREEDEFIIWKVEQGIDITSIAKLMQTHRSGVGKRARKFIPKKPAVPRFTIYGVPIDDTDASQSPGRDTSHPGPKS